MVYNKNMKNDLNSKKFRFRYSVWVIILLSLVCAFSAGGIVWNVLSIIKAFGPFASAYSERARTA